MMTNLAFFPRHRLFWLYHSVGIGLFLVVHIAIELFRSRPATLMFFQIMGVLDISVLLTFTCLGFRFIYHRFALKQWRVVYIIIASLTYGIMASAISTVALLLTLFPFSFTVFYEDALHAAPSLTQQEFIMSVYAGNFSLFCLFSIAWIFMYLSVVGIRRIRETEINNLRLQNSLKEAQLSHLSNQLNPHFLFNALNNIRFTIHEDAEKADKMITALSELLRYSLEQAKQEKVTLQEELDIIQRYIKIASLQLEDRLLFKTDIADEHGGYLIPPMSLHLLVENAIKHGIDNSREKGLLSIQTILDEQSLIIHVRNTVPVNQQLLPTVGMQIGLSNIQQRLALLYGDRAVCTIKKSTSEFCVSLQLPKEML